jgi:hypothetical protein
MGLSVSGSETFSPDAWHPDLNSFSIQPQKKEICTEIFSRSSLLKIEETLSIRRYPEFFTGFLGDLHCPPEEICEAPCLYRCNPQKSLLLSGIS